ncbi:MAG: type II toxin-antitoxin system Phd/YefM family antitoxin [Amaricoccus sp.]
MDTSVTVSEARDKLAEVIGRVQFGGERVTVAKRGKPVASESGAE